MKDAKHNKLRMIPCTENSRKVKTSDKKSRSTVVKGQKWGSRIACKGKQKFWVYEWENTY